MDQSGIEAALLRFDETHPRWTRRLFSLAGEDAGCLDELERGGLIAGCEESGYSLTEHGVARFKECATEFWLEADPGASDMPASCAERSLGALELEILLNNAFLGRWGLKEFRPLACFPYWPDLPEYRFFKLAENRVEWTYLTEAVTRRFFDLWPQREWGEGYESDLEDFRYWTHYENIERGTLAVDLAMIHRYDFHNFISVKPLASDIHDLMNSDRLFFEFAAPDRPVEDYFAQAVRFHLYMETQRRVFVPCGRFDRDSEEQDAVNWWFWVTRTRRERDALEEKLAPYAESLVGSSGPAEFWLIAMEDLAARETSAEAFWDLFADIAKSLSR